MTTIRGRLDNRTKEEKQKQFLEALEELASTTAAAKKVKVARSTIYEWVKTDESFRKAYDQASELATDALEDEAIRRAFQGVQKPVYQGGKKVGVVNEYSDTLLIFLLKGKRPDKYKDRTQLSGDAENPVQVNTVTKVIFEDMTEQ